MNQIVKAEGLDHAGRDIVDNREDGIGLSTFSDVVQFADRASKTAMVPKQFQGKPDDIVVAIMQGMEVGLQALQSLKSIAVINGMPTIYGDAPLALVYKSGKLEYIEESVEQPDGDVISWTATCRVKRRGQPEVVEVFTGEDAKRAQLLGKPGPWQQYPARMLKFRARGFALRNAFPDVLNGIDIYEEVMDAPQLRDVTPGDDAPKGGSKASSVASKVAQKRGRDSGAKDDGAPSLSAMIKNMDAAKTEADLTEAAKDAGKLAGGDIEKARKHYRKRLDEIRAAAGHERPAPDIDVSKAADLIEKDLAATMGAGVDEVLDVYSDHMAALKGAVPDVHQRLLDLAENIRGIGGDA